MSDSINDIVLEAAPEPKVLNLDEFPDEPSGGAWPKGWYGALVLEGYSTPKGTVFTTSDGTSKDGSSRNLRICFKVSKSTETRNIQESFNYRTTDFTPERIGFVKEMREQYKDVKGRWPDGDVQRSSLALASCKSLGKAVGHSLELTDEGYISPSQFVGKSLEVYLVIDENGYNKVKHVRAVK